jgi:hypothetical protein
MKDVHSEKKCIQLLSLCDVKYYFYLIVSIAIYFDQIVDRIN